MYRTEGGHHQLHINGLGEYGGKNCIQAVPDLGCCHILRNGDFRQRGSGNTVPYLLSLRAGRNWSYCPVFLCYLLNDREGREQQRRKWWQTRGWLL